MIHEVNCEVRRQQSQSVKDADSCKAYIKVASRDCQECV